MKTENLLPAVRLKPSTSENSTFFADVEKVVDASWSTELRHNRFQFEPEGCWRVNPSSSACTLQESSLEVKRVNTIIDMYRSRQQPDGNAVVFVDTDD